MIHISLDDTKGIFKYLAGNSSSNSIFETRTLRYLKELHEEFGAEFTLLCMCRSKAFSLNQVSERWKEEFAANKSWLHWGFHAYDEDTDYSSASAIQIRNEYQETMAELERITGITEFADVIRLHKFAGNLKCCQMLHELGINGLLTSDDNRKNYYLDEEAESMLNREGRYYDVVNNLYFYKSMTRLEHCPNVINEINEVKIKGWQRIEIFTHEWQLDNDVVREQLRLCSREKSNEL